VDERAIHRVARPERDQAVVHLQLADHLARGLVHDADHRPPRCPRGRLGRGGGTRRRDPLHLLDHGEEPDTGAGHVRGQVRSTQL
ncbi:MAG: hypothetical protein AVDCRST_MAG72-926, partial [uncultured Nocardioidaceae bacterium]